MTKSVARNINNTTNPQALYAWCQAQLRRLNFGDIRNITPLTGDASFRRYFRVSTEGADTIAVLAPPETEKNAEFVAVAELLQGAGLRVPELLAFDVNRGFLLQTDLGSTLLLNRLSAATVDHWYGKALQALSALQQIRPADDFVSYSPQQMREDLQRFPQWYVAGLLQYDMSPRENQLFDDFCSLLIDQALQQPQVLTHYDFQSRNLMVCDDEELAIIDFQDALRAPMTYDLVSLLRDCYIKWPSRDVKRWACDFAEQARQGAWLDANVDDQRFMHWFDSMSLQRHVRVLGTFARLFLRDDKPGYLSDIPLVCEYVSEVAGQQPMYRDFAAWFDGTLQPLAQQQDWFQAREQSGP